MSAISVNIFEPTDPRLGRHQEHDERSLRFTALPRATKPQQVTTFWASPYPPLNQGNVGSCTGNAEAQWLNTDFAAPTRTQAHHGKQFLESDALAIYALGTHYDAIPGTYPHEDTGSTGNAVCKAGIKLGYLKSYAWLFSPGSVQAALEQAPLMLGTVWTHAMFTPHNGLVSVGKIDNTTIDGGHEYLGAGIDWTENVITCRNSWGDQPDWPGCKPGGYFAIGFGKTHNYDFERLLDEQGDAVVPHGIAQ